ncbi:MAG TPA: polysaccharide deacetylase family protein [Acidimicrobiales bacterium]
MSVLLVTLATVPGPSGAEPSAAAQAPPANQAPTSAVALAADPTGFDYAFYRGQDGGVYQRSVRDGVWSAQTSLGGKIVGAPSAALARTTLVLAVRGTDGALWLRTAQQGSWGGWQKLGGVLSAAPAVVGHADGRIDVFVRGSGDGLWARTLPFGGSWSGWIDLGGRLSTGPAAAAGAAGRVDVYVAGTDQAVWRRTRSGGTWSGWRSLGGRTYTAPAATTSPQGGEAWAFVRGTNNALYVNTSAATTGWRSLGGVLVDAPAAASIPGQVDVAVRGTDRALWSRLYRNGAWSGWVKAWTPAAPTPPASSRLGVDWTRIPTSSRVVALTFDAGANANAVPSIRRTLQTKNVPATFFLTGNWVRSFPARANEVAVSGFVVGNHSDTHPDPGLTALSDAQVRAQVANAQRAILLANGAETRPFFRFPFGDVDSRVLSIVNGQGYVGVRWTVDTLGWQGTSGGMTAQKVIDRVLGALQPGEIVLMHVGSHPTDGSMLDAAALPAMIDAIRARGYTFVTMSALTGG